MPQATWTPLANITLGSSASSVTFSNIPNTYRDLILQVDGTISSNQAFFVYFNNDTTNSNYSRVYMYGNGSSPVSGADSVPYYLEMGTGRSANTLQLLDYSATDKHKTVLSRAGQAGYITIAIAGRWANTNAITSIKLQPQGAGTFGSTSMFSLYGVIA